MTRMGIRRTHSRLNPGSQRGDFRFNSNAKMAEFIDKIRTIYTLFGNSWCIPKSTRGSRIEKRIIFLIGRDLICILHQEPDRSSHNVCLKLQKRETPLN